MKTRKELLASVKPSMRQHLGPTQVICPTARYLRRRAHALHSAGSAGGVIRIFGSARFKSRMKRLM